MPTSLTAGCLLAIGCLGFAPLAARAAEADPAAPEESPAISLSASYKGEARDLVSGGLRTGSAYLDDVDLQLSADLDKTIGWTAAQFFLYGLYNNGHSFSGDRVGDLNGISNIETSVEALRIQEAWVDQSFADGHASLRVGLYDLNTEFDTGEVKSLFLVPSHGIGPDFSQSGQNGPSIFPVTSLAARLNWNFDGGFYARAAVLDGVPGDPAHPKRTTINLSSRDGALLVGEIGLAVEHDRKWSVGVWTYTAAFPDLTTAATHRDNRGGYAAIEQRLMSRDEGCAFDLAGSLRLGVADDNINPLSSYLGAGLVATGLFSLRPDDQLGLAVAVANTGAKFRSQVALAGGDPADREINLELTYFADVTEWLSVQPDLQYVINPGADSSVDNAFVVGLRFQVKKNWGFD